MQVHVADADITNLPVDAIVNLTNSQGLMTEGLSLQIREHGGDGIETELRARAPLAIGAALITGAGDLPATSIIHVPTTAQPGDTVSVDNLRRAARAALVASSAKGLKVIAIPGLGPDADVPHDEAARAIVEEIRAHKKPFPETVYLVDSDRGVLEAFEDALHNALRRQ